KRTKEIGEEEEEDTAERKWKRTKKLSLGRKRGREAKDRAANDGGHLDESQGRWTKNESSVSRRKLDETCADEKVDARKALKTPSPLQRSSTSVSTLA